MKLCIDNDWLRQKISNDPLGEVEAGRSIRRSADAVKAIEAAAEPQESAAAAVVIVHAARHSEAALGRLVHMTRRRDRLTVAQFAERVRVSAEEVTAIESDPHYAPRPRTIHNLAEYVKVPATSLLSLLPDAPASDSSLDDAVYKFAASSDDLSGLSKSERRGLNDFVKFLSAYKGGTKADGK
ncbi:hypothetical protein LA6_006430 (plasmid) [Marinibacterium anthonyi]|nr:hypothetical protein LA6_006430 [Marinibacterium anthonyi]